MASAYECLSDPEKRKIYDVSGEEGVRSHEGGGGGPNMDDIFNQFFGGGGGGHFHDPFGHHRGHREEHFEPLFENSDVIELNLQTVFKFYRRQEIWTILFYDISKEDSREVKDEYKKLAEKMFGILKVGAINCKDEEELCEEFGVYNYPEIRTFTESGSDDGETFKGKKMWKSISNAAAAKM